MSKYKLIYLPLFQEKFTPIITNNISNASISQKWLVLLIFLNEGDTV